MRTISYLISFLLLAACTGNTLKSTTHLVVRQACPKLGRGTPHQERPCGSNGFRRS